MKPQYVVLPDTTPKILLLDTNDMTANTAIRVSAGVTVEFALEDPNDSVPTGGNPAVGPAPTWLAAPAAVNGIIQLLFPARGLRLTAAASGTATVLQQGS